MPKPKPVKPVVRRAKKPRISGGTAVGGMGGLGRAVLQEHATGAGQMLLAQVGRAVGTVIAKPKARKKPRAK